MTPQAQRIAIAEACGWKTKPHNGKLVWYHPDFTDYGWYYESELPDYLNDLNAMHEAWLSLSGNQRTRFQVELRRVVLNKFYHHYLGSLSWEEEAKVANTTASQRAEAFLRTINKWDDSK